MTTSSENPDAGDPRRSAPAALRNRADIARELKRVTPSHGRALEIASGSGEHVVLFAETMPGLDWFPTDPDAGQRASIAAWIEEAGASNIAAPRALDAAEPGWAETEPPADVVVLINLLHLIPKAAAWTVLDNVVDVLAPGGVAALYGPFLRDGETTSDGDAAFHARLQVENPGAGYKDVLDVVSHVVSRGLTHRETVRMPANNLLLVFGKP